MGRVGTPEEVRRTRGRGFDTTAALSYTCFFPLLYDELIYFLTMRVLHRLERSFPPSILSVSIDHQTTTRIQDC